MSVSGAGPDAGEMQRKRIVLWHADGHDALDRHGIPRFADGLSYTIAERIDLLAARAVSQGEDDPDELAYTEEPIRGELRLGSQPPEPEGCTCGATWPSPKPFEHEPGCPSGAVSQGEETNQ